MESLVAHAAIAVGLGAILLGGRLAHAARTSIRVRSGVTVTAVGTFILSAAVLYYRTLDPGPGGSAQP